LYPNYINDRKSLNYECLSDMRCGVRLVCISDSAMLVINRNRQASIKFFKKIPRNRKLVSIFITKLPLNAKRKAKRIYFYGVFMFMISKPLAPCAAAVMMPLPPAINRLSPIKQNRILSNKNSYPQIASIPATKVDKVVLTN